MSDEPIMHHSDEPTRQVYDVLIYAFNFFNKKLFDNRLPKCIITFHRQRKVMGYAAFDRWTNKVGQKTNEIAVNPEYFQHYPLIEIFQTICHEMVHIWQVGYGTPSRRGYHNKEWALKMRSIGLIPSSTGEPGGAETGEYMMDYILIDGSFHKACQELTGLGYDFPWVDAFPMFRLDRPVLAYTLEKNPVELQRDFLPKAFRHERNTAAPQDLAIDNLLVEESSPGHETSETIQSLFNKIPEYHSTKPHMRSGKTKYTCRSCGVNAWGKPNLRLACLDCDLELINID
jgi:hypothetical protein